MRNRIKMSIFHCKVISDIKPVLVMNESKDDLARNQRHVQFNKSYHKDDKFLASFEMGLMRQLDMFKQQKNIGLSLETN